MKFTFVAILKYVRTYTLIHNYTKFSQTNVYTYVADVHTHIMNTKPHNR